MSISLQFLGATGTVTGSKYLLSLGSKKVLVDCGLFQGFKQLRLRNWAPLAIAPSKIDAVVLTHAHLDHSGYLPLLVRDGFKGKVYCTHATRDLCRILLADSGRLQEEEADYANRHGYSKHAPAQPLYTEEDAERCMTHFQPIDFGTQARLFEDTHLSFIHAGHILGAACVEIDHQHRKICFSGDLGRSHDPVMMPPEAFRRADYLVIESTYGDRLHETEDPIEELATLINATIEKGGVVVIPSFAVGRAQSVMYALATLKKTGRIPSWLPVYLDSPMAQDVTELYQRYPKAHRLDADDCKAMCKAARMVNSVDESKALSSQRLPMVIIAASGMATGGRVLHHIAAFGSDPRNTILFTGFQAGGTRGAAMLRGERNIKIHGSYVPIRARVSCIHNLSAHADWQETVDWLKQLDGAPKQVFITHGEPEAAESLRHHIAETLGWEAVVPDYLSTYALQESA